MRRGTPRFWACAYAAANTFAHNDGIGLYGKAQAITYEYGGKGGEWSLVAWRDSDGINVATTTE